MRIDEPLLPHQLRAVDQMRRLRVGALYMEKGTGKTRTILELIRLRLDAGKIEKVIWLCPCDRLKSLRQELHALTGGDTDFLLLHGLESLSHSWRLALRLRESAQAHRTMLIVDGGHMIKNPRSIRTLRAMLLAQVCPYRLLVSDVPLTRSIDDMYAQWRLLDWRILGYQSFWSFSINHLDLEEKEPGKRKPRNVDYLLRRIEPYTCQVLQSDCRLPDGQREYVWQFRLPDRVMQYYRSVVERFLQTLSPSRTEVYRMILACQQMVSGRRLTSLRPLRTAPMYADARENPRLQALADVLDIFPDQRVLILCRFTYEVRDVIGLLGARYETRVFREYARSGTNADDEARILVMNRLCADPLPEATHAAEVIIHYSHDWDWGQRRKAELRAQEHTKKIVSLVAVNTIDGKILDSLKYKQSLVEMVQRKLSSLLPDREMDYAEDLHREGRTSGRL